MPKTSNKKRRQREWRRREYDGLRGMSLADDSKPYRKLESSPEPTRDGLIKRTTILSSPTSRSTSPQPPHQSQDELARSKAVPAHSVLLVPLNNPKVAAWKRVEFVLPRALGRNGFVFTHHTKQQKPRKEQPLDHRQNDGRSQSQEHLDNNETQNESIDDILFPGRRQNLEEISVAKANDGQKHPHQHESSQHEAFSASRCRKLVDFFERVHRDSVDETVDPSNFADIPHPQKYTPRTQGSTNVTDFSSNKVHSHLSSLPVSQEIVNEQTQRNRTFDDNFSKISDSPPNKSKDVFSDSKGSHHISHTPFRGEFSGRSVEEVARDKKGLRPRANSTDGELDLPQGGLCDERMVLEAYKWNHVAPCSPKGFHNLGNTCFLNATLQCLAHVPPFCQILIAISERMTKNRLNGTTNNKGQKVTFALCSLFRQAHGLGSCMSAGGAIAPRKIVGALSTIGSCGSRNGYTFRPGRQEDAHEFLVHLLDSMNDGELRAAGINQHASGWRDRLPVSRLDETTFIHRIFGGYFRSQVRCQKCNYRSNTYDPFLDLSLEVSKKSSNSVLEALAHFTRNETLDAENQWKCSGCKKYVCPTKQLTVFRPPLVLCMQLKRFSFSNSFGFGRNGFSKIHGGSGSKITKPIDFPANLNLPLSDKRSCAYALTGIVIHVGGSASSGHYTACIKRPGKNGSTQWYHLNDSFVEPMSEKNVLRQRDAYLLFYCRKEVKIEYPTPPPRSMSAVEAAEFGRIRARARTDSLSNEEKQISDHCSISISETKPSAIPMKNFVKLQKSDNDPLSSDSRTNEDSRKLSGYIRLSLQHQTSPEASFHRKYCKPERSDHNNKAPATKSSDSESTAITSSENQDAGNGANKLESRTQEQAPKSTSSQSSDPSTIDSSSDGSSTKNDSSNVVKKIALSSEKGYLGEPKIVTRSARDVKTRIVVDSSDSRGKVKVMLGPRKRNMWANKARTNSSKEKNFQLLGNLEVQRWDDDDDYWGGETAARQTSGSESSVRKDREKVVEKIQKEDQSRKRKMHLDRWDAFLDQGRQKKLRPATKALTVSGGTDPRKNQFQALQASVQRTVRGKPKGLGWQHKNGNKKTLPKNGFRN
jgi:ubiquitin C-terminal hydrolase